MNTASQSTRPSRRRTASVALLVGMATTALAGTTNGTPYSWALTDPMALPANATNIVALDASLLGPIALRADGTVLTWDGSPPPPPGLSNVVAIAAGDVFHLALTADGRPVAWGGLHVESVAITTPPVWLTNVVAISAGYAHSIALTSDGYLIPWGANYLNVLNAPARTFNPRSFSAGQQTVLVIEENGRPFGWGADNSGILTFPTAFSNAVQISASPYMHALGLRADGRVFAWGNNSDGQATVPPGLTNIVQVCAGPQWSLALRDDGTVRIWGQPNVPWTEQPSDPVRFLSVAAGNQRNFGLTRAPVPRDVFWSTNVPAGSSLNLGRTFLGSDPFEVQWLLNGQPIPSRTNALLNLTNIQAAGAGRYQLVASNQFGSSTSLAIDVGVSEAPPRILGQPESMAFTRGTDGFLTVRAVGTDPLLYQWYFNDGLLAAQTNATLALPVIGSTNDGRYHVVVSNGIGAIVSRAAVLSTGLPAFTREPNSFHGLAGRPVRIEAQVIAPETPTFSWWHGTNLIEGNTSPVLEIARIQPGLTGEYRLVASNSFGAVTSRIAHVSIREPRRPLSEPMAAIAGNLGQAPPPGFTAVLDARMKVDPENGFAIGIRPDRTLTVWGPNGGVEDRITPPAGISNVVALSIGSTHAVVLLENGTVRAWRDEGFTDYGQALVPPGLDRVVDIEAATQFNLALRDDGDLVSWPYVDTFPPALRGVAAISIHELTVGALREDGTVWYWDQFSPASPAISDPMDAIAIAAGVDFVAVLRRDGTVRKMFRGGTLQSLPAIEGNPAVVEISAYGQTVLARTAEGRVWAFSTGSGSWAEWTSNLVRVSRLSAGLGTAFAFTVAPHLFSPPSPATVSVGTPVQLAVGATSTSPLQYQWLLDGVPLAGQTAPLLSFDPIQYQDIGNYAVVVSNNRAAVTSAPVRITVVGPPQIIALGPQSVLAGNDLVLQHAVLGPGPLRYTWYFRGQPIAGATNAILRIANAQSKSAGAYEVQVANNFGSQRSPSIVVSVNPSGPRIAAPATNNPSVLEGGPLRLAVDVRGSEPLFYQWHFNGTPIAGETNALFTRPAALASDAGTFVLRVANALGSADSSPIELTVVPTAPVVLNLQPWRLANTGNPFAWTPTIAGSAPLFRQWKKDGTDIPGATNSTLAFADISTNDAGFYTLYLSNHLGEAVSGLMQLVVRPGNRPGALITWGQPRPPMDFGIIQDFALGGNHAHALLTNGTVRSWVNGPFNDLFAPPGLDDVVSLAAGSTYAMALRSDGTLRMWGATNGGVLNMPTNLGRVVAISAGAQHALALLENGAPVNWGTVVGFGRTNIPASATNLIAIDAQAGYNIGLRRNGTVVGWGPNSPVTIPNSVSNIIRIEALSLSGVALRTDLRPVSWGSAPPPSTAFTNLVSIAAGNAHGLGLRTNGTVVAWGSSGRGQTAIPPGLSNVTAIFAGLDASAALTRSPVFSSPLAATVQPTQLGDPVRLAASIQGFGPISLQWFANDQAIPGETNATLLLGPTGPTSNVTYTLRASNAWQTVVSPTFRVAPFGPVEFRWNLTNPAVPMLFIRAPGLDAIRLQESTDLVDWTSLETLFLPPEGLDYDPSDPFFRDLRFFRWVVP
jgi:alpha-tubulin suppressor-like RCC1 family protein